MKDRTLVFLRMENHGKQSFKKKINRSLGGLGCRSYNDITLKSKKIIKTQNL